jgi:ribosomal protein S18 acetylase RimI-like enzyme
VDVVVRRATEDDFDALVGLDQASAIHHAALDPAFYRVPPREAIADFLLRRLTDPNRQVLVAEVDGQVVGCVDVTLVDDPDLGSIVRPIVSADLGISVEPAWRGRGIGHALMAAAEANARERGAVQVILDMAVANVDARRFYERLGYEVHGLFLRRAIAPDGSNRDAPEMAGE